MYLSSKYTFPLLIAQLNWFVFVIFICLLFPFLTPLADMGEVVTVLEENLWRWCDVRLLFPLFWILSDFFGFVIILFSLITLFRWKSGFNLTFSFSHLVWSLHFLFTYLITVHLFGFWFSPDPRGRCKFHHWGRERSTSEMLLLAPKELFTWWWPII